MPSSASLPARLQCPCGLSSPLCQKDRSSSSAELGNFCIFSTVKSYFFPFFIKLISAPVLFKEPTPSQINLIKISMNHFLILKNFKLQKVPRSGIRRRGGIGRLGGEKRWGFLEGQGLYDGVRFLFLAGLWMPPSYSNAV